MYNVVVNTPVQGANVDKIMQLSCEIDKLKAQQHTVNERISYATARAVLDSMIEEELENVGG